MEWKASDSVLPIHGGPCDNVPHSAHLHCQGHRGSWCLGDGCMSPPSPWLQKMAPWQQQTHTGPQPLPTGSVMTWTIRLRSEGKASFTEQSGLQRGQRGEDKRARVLSQIPALLHLGLSLTLVSYNKVSFKQASTRMILLLVTREVLINTDQAFRYASNHGQPGGLGCAWR